MGKGRRARRLGALTAVIAAALVSAVPASAADRFAAVGGVGGNPCDFSAPCPIELAINGASGVTNDDVTLLGGLPPAPYVVTTPLSVAAGVTVHGAPGARPVIDTNAGFNDPGVDLHAGSVLRDVVVEFDGVNFPAVRLSEGGMLERVTAIATEDSGSASGGCQALGPGTPIIRDSVCWHGEDLGANGGGVAARVGGVAGTQTLTLRNVTAGSSNTRPGIEMVDSGIGEMILNGTNVIAQTGTGAADVAESVVGGGPVVLDHSNYDSEADFPGPGVITDPGTGTNQLTPPVFVDAAAGDFRQAANSVGTIDLGIVGIVNGTDLGDFDFEGLARVAGTQPDIGADEFGPPPVPEVLGTNPLTGSNDNNPQVHGVAVAAATVSIFDDAACTPPARATGTEAQFNGTGIPVAVADNTTTTFYAQAAGLGGDSGCSATFATYAEVTPPAFSPPPESGAITGLRAAALKKCKRQKKRLQQLDRPFKKKFKKCRRKARRLPV